MSKRAANPELQEILVTLSARADYIEERTQYGAMSGFIWLICFGALSLIMGFPTLWAFASLLLLSFILSGLLTGLLVTDPETALRKSAAEVLTRRVIDRNRANLDTEMRRVEADADMQVDLTTRKRAVAARIMLDHEIPTADLSVAEVLDILETKLSALRPVMDSPQMTNMLQRVRYTRSTSPSPFRPAGGVGQPG